MLKLIISLILFVYLPSHSSAQDHSARDTSKIAILNLNSPDIWLTDFKNAKPAQLTDKDFTDIEKLLRNCVKENNQGIELKRYKRQYVPYINSKGQKEVYVNCFCFSDEIEFKYWRKQLVMVDDGGDCFFHVTINLTTNKCGNLYVNGLAMNSQ